MTPERMMLLEQIGFVFDGHEAQWLDMLQEIASFINQFGHSKTNAHTKLGMWVRRQRRLHAEGTLSKNRVDLLEEVGFDWQI